MRRTPPGTAQCTCPLCADWWSAGHCGSHRTATKEFIFIVAAVIGGCLLTGGYGSVVGASIGALIFGMTQLGINYAGWNPDWFRTFLGVMLLLATIVNLYVKRRTDLR
jgi:simple sugar transport system permease protein